MRGQGVVVSEPLIHLASPCYGGQASADYMRSLLVLAPACKARAISLQFDISGGEALIGRARGPMLARFLATAATHLLFVDADIGFAPEALFRLLDSGHDIVGGLYPRRPEAEAAKPSLEYDPLSPAGTPDAQGFARVAAVGAGFLLIARPAAQRIVDGHPQLRARLGDVQGAGAEAPMLFDSFVDLATGRYLNDYQAFCHRWRSLGGDVWADFRSPITHAGRAHAAAEEA